MSLSQSPPPLELPAEFAQDKYKRTFFEALLRTFYQMWQELYYRTRSAKITTTNATPTALLSVEIPTNRTIYIDSRVVARRTGGSSGTEGDSAWYRLTGGYKNINGTLSIIGTASLDQGEDQSGWAVQYSSSGTLIVLTVTGAADNNITWECDVEVTEVGK